MEQCRIGVFNAAGEARAQTPFGPFPILAWQEAYQPGDSIRLEVETPGLFWQVQLEDSMPPTLVYLAQTTLRLDVPFNEQKLAYSPKAFSGSLHMLSARLAEPGQAMARRNLALNPYDSTAAQGCFPHASANIETRGEAVFAARNTIDGIYANSSHGGYPFQSWGINRNPQAELKIDLGLPCLVDEARLTLRADFPHDNYWTQGCLNFSDGSTETISLQKTALPQSFRFKEKRVSWVSLNRLIQADDPSPFPALTEIELWGRVYMPG